MTMIPGVPIDIFDKSNGLVEYIYKNNLIPLYVD